MFGDIFALKADDERLRKLRKALGLLGMDEEATLKVATKTAGVSGLDAEDHVIQMLRDGLDITDADARELLENLRTVLLDEGDDDDDDEPDDIEEDDMALKSNRSPKGESMRDRDGFQRGDPLGLGLSREETQRTVPERDAHGYRTNKPFDPRRNQRR